MDALSETASYNCEFCGSLLDQICEKLKIENRSTDYKVLTYTFDYIKKIPERNPKLAKRKNGEHYIVHLIETARLLLKVSKKLSLKQIVVALLHDSIEDVKEIDINELTYYFGKEIADSVAKLSKEEIPSYITQSIREEKKLKEILNIVNL